MKKVKPLQSISLALTMFLSPLLAGPVTASSRVDQELFAHTVKRLMGDNAMGFAFAVADRHNIVAEVAGGWAQHRSDGNLPMSTTVPIGWGSNQKVLSGVALIDLLERRSAPLKQELRTPIHFFLPDRWDDAYFNRPFRQGLRLITLRDILDHTSGLPLEADRGSHGTQIARALFDGNNTIAHSNNTRQYNNNNYTLLLYIIPTLAYPEDVAEIEEAARDLSLSDYNRRVAHEFGKLYTRYMYDRFLPAVPGNVVATCRPGDLAANRYAKEYDGPNDRSGRTDNADVYCRAQGGWFYSVRGMARIWQTIEFTENIVDANSRALWPASNRKARLIYWRTQAHPSWTIRRTGEGFRGHGGGTRFGTNSITLRLPWHHVGVAVANSDNISTKRLSDVLLAAFYEATRTAGQRHINLPGRDYDSFIVGNPDPKYCRDTCRRESRCRAWTYVAPGDPAPAWR